MSLIDTFCFPFIQSFTYSRYNTYCLRKDDIFIQLFLHSSVTRYEKCAKYCILVNCQFIK